MKLAILSDIHSAAGAFEAALTSAEEEGFDLLVILGDLLTYGPFPERVLEITAAAVARHDSVLIRGNHDELYLGALGYGGSPLPEWIQESAEWTSKRIALDQFSRLDWRAEFCVEKLLLAHANPYGFGNWAYLRTDQDLRAAVATLASRGMRHGIFGHVHRFNTYEHRLGSATTLGSIGQPRSGQTTSPEWAMAQLDGDDLRIERRLVDYNWSAHCQSIQATNMSDDTKTRLCGYFA